MTENDFSWRKEPFESSISRNITWFTPYDAGWDGCREHGADMAGDEELKEIVRMEHRLESVPDWARQIVERGIRCACPCGHYTFPNPYLEVLDAIRAETPRTFVHGCFTVDSSRKKELMDYCLCLDAWIDGTTAEATAAELEACAHRQIDWRKVCADIWGILGEREEWRVLIVERLLATCRHAIKQGVWEDDLASQFCRDLHLGKPIYEGDRRNPAKIYSYIDGDAPGFDISTSSRVRRIEERLKQICPPDLLPHEGETGWFQEWWLCAPKSLRFIEILVYIFGKGRHLRDDEQVPGFLQCEDTYPDQDSAAEWFSSFLASLDDWWQDRPMAGPVAEGVAQRLGSVSPVKKWLIRLFLRRLQLLAEYSGSLTKLVRPSASAKRGTKKLGIG